MLLQAKESLGFLEKLGVSRKDPHLETLERMCPR